MVDDSISTGTLPPPAGMIRSTSLPFASRCSSPQGDPFSRRGLRYARLVFELFQIQKLHDCRSAGKRLMRRIAHQEIRAARQDKEPGESRFVYNAFQIRCDVRRALELVKHRPADGCLSRLARSGHGDNRILRAKSIKRSADATGNHLQRIILKSHPAHPVSSCSGEAPWSAPGGERPSPRDIACPHGIPTVMESGVNPRKCRRL